MTWIGWLWIGLGLASLVLLFLAARYLIVKIIPGFTELEKLTDRLTEMQERTLQVPKVEPAVSQIGDDPAKHIQARRKLIKEKQARTQLRERRLVARLKAMSNKESG